LFEELTGRKCQGLFIDLIVPKWGTDGKLESYANQVVRVNYLKNDVKILLDYFKEDIINEMEDVVVDADEPY
jgi:hypothetical protein